ncbi:hypothetical protein COHA_006852 [Chlorella ohadii]|uniref:Ubiquitin-like domain-containing protein n=1 Tax=Chlorella ohadii TaxID=2649997 RepID=A0AAD5H0G0_9CHLO|nr:hypothetical protein COHA_006852 [Chlorella ohadii]
MCALSLPLQIAVNLPDGRSIQLPVFEAACVPDVTSRVAALLDCAPADVRLWPVGGGGPLVEADKVVPGACFRASLDIAPGPGRATLYVKTLTGGKSVKVQLTLDSTVDDLKRAVTEREGIPFDQQRLIFQGRQLEDGLTLASCKVYDGATLDLVLRLGGGMFALSSGRAGNFKKLGLAKVEPEVAATASSGRTLLEVVLPDGSSVLLGCNKRDGSKEILAALRQQLAAANREAAVLAADVDELQDVGAMRELLGQAQAALRRRQP